MNLNDYTIVYKSYRVYLVYRGDIVDECSRREYIEHYGELPNNWAKFYEEHKCKPVIASNPVPTILSKHKLEGDASFYVVDNGKGEIVVDLYFQDTFGMFTNKEITETASKTLTKENLQKMLKCLEDEEGESNERM